MSTYKQSERAQLRGKLDSLNASIVLLQSVSADSQLVDDLEEVRGVVRSLQRSEACNEAADVSCTLWGLTLDELHGQSHNPEGGHIMPHYDMGREAAGLNFLRTQIRETELAACRCFNDDPLRICCVLNRLSSAVYVLTYKYMPKDYNHILTFGKS